MTTTVTVQLEDEMAMPLQALARLAGVSVSELLVTAATSLIDSRRVDARVAEQGARIVAELDALFGEGWSDLAASNLRHPSNGRVPGPPPHGRLHPVTGYL